MHILCTSIVCYVQHAANTNSFGECQAFGGAVLTSCWFHGFEISKAVRSRSAYGAQLTLFPSPHNSIRWPGRKEKNQNRFGTIKADPLGDRWHSMGSIESFALKIRPRNNRKMIWCGFWIIYDFEQKKNNARNLLEQHINSVERLCTFRSSLVYNNYAIPIKIT